MHGGVRCDLLLELHHASEPRLHIRASAGDYKSQNCWPKDGEHAFRANVLAIIICLSSPWMIIVNNYATSSRPLCFNLLIFSSTLYVAMADSDK